MSKGDKEIKISHYLWKLCRIKNQMQLIQVVEAFNDYLNSVNDKHHSQKQSKYKP